MESQPETTPDDTSGVRFGVGDRALAAVLLCGALALAYVCADVLAGGRITRTLSAPRE